MNWIKLPSGKRYNLDYFIEVSPLLRNKDGRLQVTAVLSTEEKYLVIYDADAKALWRYLSEIGYEAYE